MAQLQVTSGSSRRFLLANSAWLLIGRGGVQLLGMIIAILVARGLGDAGLGHFTVVMTVVFVGNVISTFGLDTYLIRTIAADPQQADLSAVLLIQLALAAVFIAAVWLLAPETVIGSGSRVYVLALVPLAFTSVYGGSMRAHEQMNSYTAVQLFGAGCRVVIVAILLFTNQPFIALMWGLLGCQLLEALAAGWLSPDRLNLPLGWGWPKSTLLKTLVRTGFSLALLTLLAVLYQRVAGLLLARWGDPSDVGQFSAALRLVEAPRMIPYAVVGALFPRLMKEAGTEQLSGRWFLWLTLGTAALALAIQPLAPWLIPLLFGDGFAQAVPLLRSLIWSLIPFVGVTYGSLLLVARYEEKRAAAGHAIALALAVGLGWLFWQRWGLIGFAWALVTAESIHAMILLWGAHLSGPPQEAI